LNPLDRSERFQATSVLLPRTSPDASWAHGRRDLFKLAELAKAPVAIEAVQRIDAIFDVERTINGLPIEQRRAARQAQIGALVDDLQGWMRDVRTKMSRHADVAKASTIC
jgi:transposase